MIDQTIRLLHEIRLKAMADNFVSQSGDPTMSALSFEERVGIMVDAEATARANRKMQSRVKEAAFRYPAHLENFREGHRKGLDRATIASLGTCSWLRQKTNVLLVGPTGTGKTWIACALGHRACREGMRVRFERLPRLLEKLRIAMGDGSYLQALDRLHRYDLLILDDLGAGAIDLLGRNSLLEIVEARTEVGSMIVTSQMPVGMWHTYIAGENPTVADSVMDRLVQGALRIDLSGPSMRGGGADGAG